MHAIHTSLRLSALFSPWWSIHWIWKSEISHGASVGFRSLNQKGYWRGLRGIHAIMTPLHGFMRAGYICSLGQWHCMTYSWCGTSVSPEAHNSTRIADIDWEAAWKVIQQTAPSHVHITQGGKIGYLFVFGVQISLRASWIMFVALSLLSSCRGTSVHSENEICNIKGWKNGAWDK